MPGICRRIGHMSISVSFFLVSICFIIGCLPPDELRVRRRDVGISAMVVGVKKQPVPSKRPQPKVKKDLKLKPKGAVKGPVNKFAKFPPKECHQCEQTTHDIDRDSKDVPNMEPIFLHWTKMNSRVRKASTYHRAIMVAQARSTMDLLLKMILLMSLYLIPCSTLECPILSQECVSISNLTMDQSAFNS